MAKNIMLYASLLAICTILSASDKQPSQPRQIASLYGTYGLIDRNAQENDRRSYVARRDEYEAKHPKTTPNGTKTTPNGTKITPNRTTWAGYGC